MRKQLFRINKFIGDETIFPVEHRILNIVLLLGLFLATISTVFFSIFQLGSIPLLVGMASLGFLSGLYYISAVAKKYTLASLLVILIFGFGIVPLTWFSLGGITGGTPLYAIMYVAMITTLLRGSRRIIVLISFILMLLVLLLVQYHNPSWIHYPYRQNTEQYIDLFFAMLLSMIAIVVFFVTILHYYIREHQRSKDYQLQLERKSIEVELARLDRLNLIGEMAASIGHEVRNPLTTVRGFLQYFQGKPALAEYADRFKLMIDELDRANQIITEFLSLAKNKAVNLKPDNLSRIIETLYPLMQAEALLMGKELKKDIQPTPNILIDENEMRQCILNLVRNALEAIDGNGAVLLKLYFEHHEVVLAVQDTGRGIPPDVFAKLGTPFITTKNQGTGLGLPVCYRIAERHHADLQIQTSPSGTTVFIRFQL